MFNLLENCHHTATANATQLLRLLLSLLMLLMWWWLCFYHHSVFKWPLVLHLFEECFWRLYFINVVHEINNNVFWHMKFAIVFFIQDKLLIVFRLCVHLKWYMVLRICITIFLQEKHISVYLICWILINHFLPKVKHLQKFIDISKICTDYQFFLQIRFFSGRIKL